MKKTRFFVTGGIFSLFLLLSLSLFKTDVQAGTKRTTMLDVSKFTADQSSSEGWEWDQTTKTLTLIDVDIETEDDCAIRLPRTSCRIEVQGNNILKADYADISCVGGENIAGTLTVIGDGTLDMTSGTKGFQYEGDMVLRDINLLYNGDWTFSFVRKLTIDNCYVCAQGTASSYDETYTLIGARDEVGDEGALTLKNCYVEQGGGKVIYSKSISFIGTGITTGAKKIVIKRGTAPANVSKVSTKSIKYSKDYSIVKLNWTVPKYSSGAFTVWRSTRKGSGYKKIATVYKPYYKDTKRAFRKTYYYKIKAYKIGSSSKTSMSGYKAVTTGLASVKNYNYIRYSSKDKMVWDKVYGAQGYKIYRATSLKGSYKCIKTIKKGSTTNYSVKRPNSSKTYYYKIRAYRKKGKKTYYSAYTTVYEDDMPDE